MTLDTPGALDAVERGRRSGWSIGVGTVLEPDQVNRSVDAGAAFVVSPDVVPGVIERALELGVDIVPGAFTSTEVMRAHSMGVSAVKLFPASLGGPGYVRALLGPLAAVPLVPTGGIAIEEVGAYLAAGAACVGLGGRARRRAAAYERHGARRHHGPRGGCGGIGRGSAVTEPPMSSRSARRCSRWWLWTGRWTKRPRSSRRTAGPRAIRALASHDWGEAQRG